MDGTSVGGPAPVAAVAVLRAGVDALLGCGLSGLSGVELTGLLADVEVQRRRLESVDQGLLAEVAGRGVAGEYACSGPVELLVQLLRVDAGEARARVARARELGPRRELSGQPLPPILALTAAAQRAGTISATHVAVISRCIDQLPAEQAGQVTGVVEQFLVGQAERWAPRLVARDAARLLAHLDQDGAEPGEPQAQRRRELTLHRAGDGTMLLSGRLTPAAGATWQVILDALSAPLPSSAGERDDRTPSQRRHDGFLEAGQRLLRSATLPESGGAPVTVLVRLDATHLRTGTGLAETDHGELLPVPDLLHLAAEADIIPAVLNHTGGILAYGQHRRVASPQQRRALALRDGGCSFPGCTRPPAWCQAHHIRPWAQDGPTNLDNLCLLCSFHHREFHKRGWQVRIHHAIPEWIPPPWLDPQQTPQHNHTHHPELAFPPAA